MPGLCTIDKFDIKTVLEAYRNWNPDVDGRDKTWEVNGQKWRTKMNSLRYAVFSRSITCVGCGLEGQFFLLQTSQGNKVTLDRAHFNLYAHDSNKDLILFTKDHIIPRSKGGKDILSNLQTMCMPCNSAKGNVVPKELEDAEENRG